MHSPSLVSAVQCEQNYGNLSVINNTVLRALRSLMLPGRFIAPQQKIVLKPNWVKEHDERHPGPDQWDHVVTHPLVIGAVIRWVASRLQGSGSITVCDAPQTDSSFEMIRAYCRLDELVESCRRDFPGIHIQ